MLTDRQIAVLFARRDSIYFSLADCDVWDAARNALLWPGGVPCIAHPPCRLWGQLRQFSSAPAEEKDLGPWAIAQVRRWGGVVEHPASSGLWAATGCPTPAQGHDRYEGWTLGIHQYWFGHRACKPTWLYIVGCEPSATPPVPLVLGEAMHVIGRKRPYAKPEVSKREREATPPALAHWLVEVAHQCRKEALHG